MKIQRTFLVLFVLLWLQACSSVSGPVHFYPGAPRPNNETARLRVPAPITVVKIDGRDVAVPSKDKGFYDIYLLPGVHRIDFKYELSWGDRTSAILVKSDVVGVKSRFFAGKNYELTYSVPEDQEEAYLMSRKFKAQLLEKETGRQVASRTTAELSEFKMKMPIANSSGVAPQPKNAATLTAKSAGIMPPTDINADTAVREDAVKRLKFWWLMADEEERSSFKKWMKSVEGAAPKE